METAVPRTLVDVRSFLGAAAGAAAAILLSSCAELAAGRTPQLAELRLHNGTVYRWNRPVYDVVAGRPHLRVENRVLPAGPTVIDMLANAAFYYGMLRTLAEDDRPVWTKMRFAAAQHNFLEAARHGMQANLFWPGMGTVTTEELVIGRYVT